MECINSHDEFKNVEVPRVDDALLMSFLDDTQVEDCDDEKLSSVIRSLEAEIDQRSIDYDQKSSSGDNNWTSDLSDNNLVHFDGHDNPRPDHGLGFNWADMEMEMDMVPSSPSDGMASWYMDPCGDDMNGVTDFGSEKDFYYFQNFNGISFEDQEYSAYNSTLWQETNAPFIH